jgi:hypothetical protein
MEPQGSGGLAVTLLWGDGEHTFRLPAGAWRKIDQRCGVGPEELAARLAPTVQGLENRLGALASMSAGLVGRWRPDDVREVLLQGLLYGEPELGPVTVARLVNEYFDERPLRENCLVAFAVVMASLEGLPDLEPKPAGEAKGTVSPEKLSKTRASRGRKSTNAAGAPA